jgi:alpha-1,3-rhamnosyl/mannosyltransferase
VGINAIALLSSLTGVGQYTRSLIHELIKRDEFDLHFFYARSWSRRLRKSPLAGIDTWKTLIKRVVPEPYLLSRAAQQVIFSAGANLRRIQLYHDPNFLAYRFDGPTVITVHDLSWVRYPQTHPAERVAALNRFFPRSLDLADQIVTDAEYIREEVIRTYGVDPKRITAVPLAARSAFHPCEEAECGALLKKLGLQWRRYLLSVGTLEPRKNIELTLRAYASLPERLQERFPLVVVGMRGWLMTRLESLIEPLVRSGRVRTLGYVSDAELAQLYACARLLVYPSLYEGFGLPPLEAMASGTPVIVSNTSTLPEVVGDAGVLTDPTDVDGLRLSITQLAEDDTEWSRRRDLCLQRAALFSWARCARETVDIYRRAQESRA